jgi:hypothetical protein
LILLTLLASTSRAADGAIEINHACATLTGCLSGDTAGYPVTLGHPGSYRLTGNLIVPDAATTAIEIDANDVSLDLGGFAISRADCVGAGVSCPRISGAGYGIDVYAAPGGFPFAVGVAVYNGHIVGMGSGGVSLGHQSDVVDVTVRASGQGITVGEGSRVHRCAVEDLTTWGVHANSGSTVTENRISAAGDDGLLTFTGGLVIARNAIFSNSDKGIEVGYLIGPRGGSVFLANSIYENGGAGVASNEVDGVFLSAFFENTLYLNGQDETNPLRQGIAAVKSLLLGNSSTFNGGAGLHAAQSGYRLNAVNENGGGTVSGAGAIDLGANVCDGSTTCP